MININEKFSAFLIVAEARRIADYASSVGIHKTHFYCRDTYNHIGAVLADVVLQAGLNYFNVVRPRVMNIIDSFPDMNCVVNLVEMVNSQQTPFFLSWQHAEKIQRFERLVIFLHNNNINYIDELRVLLMNNNFCSRLLKLNGIGPKTIDYMSCLVGLDCIAVDRHIRSFAKRAGIEINNYHFLKLVFSYAADMLSISRREFDSWVWCRESENSPRQFVLPFCHNTSLHTPNLSSDGIPGRASCGHA